MNVNPRCSALDCAHLRSAEGEPVFVEVPAPTDEALHAVLNKIMTRTRKLLIRLGVLVEVKRSTCVAAKDADWNEVRDVSFAAGISTAPRAAVGRHAPISIS